MYKDIYIWLYTDTHSERNECTEIYIHRGICIETYRQAHIHAHKHVCIYRYIVIHSAYTRRHIDTRIHLDAERQAHMQMHTEAATCTHKHVYTDIHMCRETGTYIKQAYIVIHVSILCSCIHTHTIHLDLLTYIQTHTPPTLTSPPKLLSTGIRGVKVSRNLSPDKLWGQCSCSQRWKNMESPTDMP